MLNRLLSILSLSKTLLSLVVFLGVLALTSDILASVVIKIDPDKRIQTPISYDSTNRIAFANDRIAQIFGDEEAYTLQSDETRGQLFLKPTEANGEKPIAVTLITEQGIVQDMEFTPQKISTRTIILKGEGGHKPSFDKPPHSHRKESDEQSRPVFSPSSLGLLHPPSAKISGGDRSAHLIQAIREVARQDMESVETDTDIPRPLTIPNLKVEGVRVVNHQDTSVSVYMLTNTSDELYEVVENAFSGEAVLAISVESQQLKPKESTRLFVVRAI